MNRIKKRRMIRLRENAEAERGGLLWRKKKKERIGRMNRKTKNRRKTEGVGQ